MSTTKEPALGNQYIEKESNNTIIEYDIDNNNANAVSVPHRATVAEDLLNNTNNNLSGHIQKSF